MSQVGSHVKRVQGFTSLMLVVETQLIIIIIVIILFIFKNIFFHLCSERELVARILKNQLSTAA
jgi:hypothetical protein